MKVPDKFNIQWKNIVTGKSTYNLKFLAAKILLGRMMLHVSNAGTPKAINDAVDQLYTLYQKNISLPSAQQDLKTIFG